MGEGQALKTFDISLTSITEFSEVPLLDLPVVGGEGERPDRVLGRDLVAVPAAAEEVSRHHLDPPSDPELVRRLLLVPGERVGVVLPHVPKQLR